MKLIEKGVRKWKAVINLLYLVSQMNIERNIGLVVGLHLNPQSASDKEDFEYV
jgi:hypothetical protein